MRVSVIIPIFNVEQYIEECLASVVAQTHRDLDIILVDDASTDGSIARCDPFLSDPRVRLISHAQNRGLSSARNSGIEAASGEYLLFVDSDDIVSERLVEICVATTQKLRTRIHFFQHCSFVSSVPAGQELPLNPFDVSVRLIEGNHPSLFAPPYYAWLKFIRRTWLLSESIKFREGELYEDHRFHWDLAGSGQPVALIEAALYAYRVRSGSITSDPVRALVRLDILRDLLNAGAGSLSSEALEVGERTMLAGCVTLLATVSDRHLSEIVSRVCEECALVRERSTLRSARTPLEWMLLHVAARDNAAARTALLSLVRIIRFAKRLLSRRTK